MHMQTPMDRHHWRGQPLPQNPTADDLETAADAYVRRCYDTGLELIGITEHNFAPGPNQSFIPFLEAAVGRVAADLGYRLTIFPGFEVTGPIGTGAHLICLFDPGTALVHVDAKLTELGLPPNARFRNGEPRPMPTADMTFAKMLRLVQDDPQLPGICFAAHPNDAGVLDGDTVEQWWSQEVISNNSFLCMELPRPRAEYVAQQGNPLVRSVILNSDPRYGRNHPIAVIRNSDAKNLEPDAQHHANFIGFRHSWLKMSELSIEGLRQAFLDHESRIRFGDVRPEDTYTYPRIKRLAIRSVAFLADQEIDFSPNLNTLIGGGGTGKSTIIEYLRLLLNQKDAITSPEVRANFDKIERTIGNNSQLEVEIERDGRSWLLRRLGHGRSEVVEGEDIPNLRKFFPVRFYSQREIYAIADSREARGQLLDNLIREELDAIGRQSERAIQALRQLDERVRERDLLSQRLRDLQTERLTLATRLESLKKLEAPLAAWRSLLAERDFIDGLQQTVQSGSEAVKTGVEEAADLFSEPKMIGDESPHHELLTLLENNVQTAWQTTREAIEGALAGLDQAANEAFGSEGLNTWKEDFAAAELEYTELRERLEAEGSDPDEYLAYELQLRLADAEIATAEERLAALANVEAQRDETLVELRELWASETQARASKAEALQEAIPLTRVGTPFVEVNVEQYGDEQAFKEQMATFLKDRRRISEDDWELLLDKVVERTAQGTSPAQTFTSWIGSVAAGVRPHGFPWTLNDRRTQVLNEWCNPEACSSIDLLRVPDKLTVTLYRDDGTRAGELEEGLSVGQRSTSVLTLLLAHDDAPAVIDQPEDEVDNEFTYLQLVPLLRRVKEERQLLISTHDPNLPVNGDAELIYALEARDGRGQVKDVNGTSAVGALDNAAVLEAVEDIMEGSEEAFRRRYEKYGF
jgi:hypothetical protein